MAKLTIKSIGVLSVAKIYAAIMFVISLLISIPYGLFIMIFGVAAMGSGAKEGMAAGGGAIVIGIIIMIVIPIVYGVFGFIGGAIGALLYNLFSKMVGGVELEVEGNMIGNNNPPPPPRQW
jgi:hypothetical protein